MDKKEEGEISRGEADNFWHESHKTLRGEQIINSNSTKKMAAAEPPPPPLDDGDAVATNSPLSLFSAFPTQSLKICMYICGAATSLTHGENEKEISLSLSRSPPRRAGSRGAVENVIGCENLQINSGGWTKKAALFLASAIGSSLHWVDLQACQEWLACPGKFAQPGPVAF